MAKPILVCTTSTCASNYSPLSLFVLQVSVPVTIQTSASLYNRYLCQYPFKPLPLCATGTPVPEPILASASLYYRYLRHQHLCPTGTCGKNYCRLSLFALQIPVLNVLVPIQASASLHYRYLRQKYLWLNLSSLSSVHYSYLCLYPLKPQPLCTGGTCVSTYSSLSLVALQVPAPVQILTSASLLSSYLWQNLI